MQNIHDKITVYSPLREIDEIVQNHSQGTADFTIHFNQNEEFFLKLPSPFTVFPFPIHHDVTVSVPGEAYLASLKKLLLQIVPVLPSVFGRMRYFFNPAEIFHPSFYQVLKYKGQMYLYLLKLDLSYRPNDGELLLRGSNDTTNRFKTNNLYLEGDLIPLKGVGTERGHVQEFILEQNISQTWIGETGRGYFIKGIWMDTELTKFISKLLTPQGKTLYPYYPFTCKYGTICHSLLDLSPKGRKQHLIYLHNARNFLIPALGRIQKALRKTSFHTDMPDFIVLKEKVPPYWNNLWNSFTVQPYLNDQGMKEYVIVP